MDIERRFSTDRLSLEEYEDFLKTVSEHYLDPSQVTQPHADAAFDAIPANTAADPPQQLLEPSSPPLSPFDPTPSHMLAEERPRDKATEDGHAVTDEATRTASRSAGPREKRKRARQEELVREVEALMSEADAAEKAAQSEEAPPSASRAHPVVPPPPEELGTLPRYHRQAKGRLSKATAKGDAKNEAEGDAAPVIEGLIDRRATADTPSALDLSSYRSSDRRERRKPRSGVQEMDEDLLDSLDDLFKPPPEPQRRAHEGGSDKEASETVPAGGRGRRKKQEASEADLAARKMAKEEKQRAEESGLLLGEVDTDADSDEEQQLPASASLSDRPAERTTAALPPFSSLPPLLSHEQAFDITSEMLEEEIPATTLSQRAALSSDGAPLTAAGQRNGDSYEWMDHGPAGEMDWVGSGSILHSHSDSRFVRISVCMYVTCRCYRYRWWGSSV